MLGATGMQRMSGRSVSSATRHFTIWILVAAGLLLQSGRADAMSVARKKHISLDYYHKAVQMREALNGRPEGDRDAEDYNRVIDAFRKVYHLAPTSTRADSSVLAVAELLAEQARLSDDKTGFKSAIGQYEFLRREYPGSKYRFGALLSIGQIYREDLNEQAIAKETFEDFLTRYPNHELAQQAKAALREMDEEAKHPGRDAACCVSTMRPGNRKSKSEVASTKNQKTDNDDSEQEEAGSAPLKTAASKHKGLPRITSLRYWSTPDYTRIAIDLDDEVKYEAGRVPSPDRIFFDLHDSRLASELIGKSYDIEDGLLKKVRIAQYKVNMARVVLEVDTLAEYSAFILPNPYRLIIDVHGRKPAPQVETANSQNPASDPRSNSSTGVPQASATKRGEAKTVAASRKNPLPSDDDDAEESVQTTSAKAIPAKATPKAPVLPKRTEVQTETSDLGLAEIASLSDDPLQVKATTKPTSGVVVENVAKRETPQSADGTANSSEQSSAKGKNQKNRKGKAPLVVASATRQAQPTADGDLSLVRALGLKIGKIVVDAGHGGHDTGTIGPNGLLEKDLVLDVALRLGKLLEQKLGADVVYTRHDDTFIPLETRTAIANQNQADLFISIHANSSSDPSARGVETYYLNFTSSPEALEVAARENSVSETSVHDLQDLVKKIALKDKIDESREFAADVQKALYAGEAAKNPGVKNRGVKKAPFIVLIGANMPSILAEISFVSNPTDERKLRTPEYRQRIAESLYRGVSHYAQGLSGVKVASAKQPVTAGQ
ncbi:MAG: N-acetylmuramoyl-L-alanine amidase [Acidobacteria bacterium]|nr:MAG: N-acetylmuramoyl-L-alanine amidase [Acidobacteriota bacterium]